MNHRKILDAWINYIYEDWLDKRGAPRFHASVEPLIAKLRQYASDRRHFDDAWHCIEQIEQLYDHIPRDNQISSRMLLECGVAAYKMGNAREAIPFLNGAFTSYNEDHDRAVARWLLGCMYWYIGDSINALSAWEAGHRHFEEQAKKSGRGTGLVQWYDEKIQEMEDAIKYAADHEAPPFPRVARRKKNPGKPHLLQSLPVIGQIPAGTPLHVLPDPVDFMSMERVRLNDQDYRAVSLLRGERVVKIPPEQSFYILRVYGNSMNQCSPEPIEDGDYVILRKQHTAENGDIVAAEITSGAGVDDRATLKRFKIQDKTIYLIPESSDPEFQKPIYVNRSFTRLDDGFHIRGVAIAVLKPL